MIWMFGTHRLPFHPDLFFTALRSIWQAVKNIFQKNKTRKWEFLPQVPFFTEYILTQIIPIVNSDFLFSVIIYRFLSKDAAMKFSINFY